jgi:hypothetical protein
MRGGQKSDGQPEEMSNGGSNDRNSNSRDGKRRDPRDDRSRAVKTHARRKDNPLQEEEIPDARNWAGRTSSS